MEISIKEGVLKHFRRFSDNCPGGKLLTTLILILSSKSSANPNQGAIFLDRNCPDTISKNSQGSTCAGVCWALTTLLKRDSSTGIFLWVFRNFKNTYFVKHLHWLFLFITLSDCGNLEKGDYFDILLTWNNCFLHTYLKSQNIRTLYSSH